MVRRHDRELRAWCCLYLCDYQCSKGEKQISTRVGPTARCLVRRTDRSWRIAAASAIVSISIRVSTEGTSVSPVTQIRVYPREFEERGCIFLGHTGAAHQNIVRRVVVRWSYLRSQANNSQRCRGSCPERLSWPLTFDVNPSAHLTSISATSSR